MQTTESTFEVTRLCGHVTVVGPREWYGTGWGGRAWLKCRNCDACETAEQAKRARVQSEGTFCYLRYGNVPASGFSRNGATGGTEAGVSVYPAYRFPGGRYVMDLTGCELSAVWLADRPVYLVAGTLLDGKGSDGEPLLAGAKARKLPRTASVEWL